MICRVLFCLISLTLGACAQIPGMQQADTEVQHNYADRAITEASVEAYPVIAPVAEDNAVDADVPSVTAEAETPSNCQRSFDMIMAFAAEKLHSQNRM